MYETKGHVVGAERVRGRIDRLGSLATSTGWAVLDANQRR
jgi:hypothetical protein